MTKYIGIDDKGKKYEVQSIDWENMTALCQGETWFGWLRCRFESFIEVEK